MKAILGTSRNRDGLKLFIVLATLLMVTTCILVVTDNVDSTANQTVIVDGLEYEIVQENEKVAKLNGFASGVQPKETLVIPDTINVNTSDGNLLCKVTEVLPYAFDSNKKITSVQIGSNLHTIGERAFFGCSSITSLTIGENVRTIGKMAFHSCGMTEELIIPNNVETLGDLSFCGCSKITSLTIGENVTTIGESAFNACDSLSSIKFNAKNCTTVGKDWFHELAGMDFAVTFNGPEGSIIPNAIFENNKKLKTLTIGENVTAIGDDAFKGCGGISSIEFNAKNCTVGSDWFKDAGAYGLTVIFNGPEIISEGLFKGNTKIETLTIGENVTTIGDGAFEGCSGITDVLMIPRNVKTIGQRAFYGCSNISWLTIGENVTTIGDGAFEGCSGITDGLIIPGNVKTIGQRAFYGCSGILILKISEGVTTIGDSAFEGCSDLLEMYFDAKCSTIGNDCFKDAGGFGFTVEFNGPEVIPAKLFKGNTNLQFLTFGWTVTTIEDGAFEGCNHIDVIVIGENVKTIGAKAFLGCSRITGLLKISDNVETIGVESFCGCSEITSLTIGKKVTNIGDNAFKGCSNISRVEFNAKNCTVGSDWFKDAGADGLAVTFDGPEDSTIPREIFWKNAKIETLTIGTNITSIGAYAFHGCNRLSQIQFNAKNCAVEGTSFDITGADGLAVTFDGPEGSIIPNAIFVNNKKLKTLTIGENVTAIGDDAFHGCSGISQLTIGENVTAIGDDAFRECSGITGKLTIPGNVKTIGQYAFCDCSGIIGLTIGKNVTAIGDSAFYGLTSLEEIVVFSTVKNFGDLTFGGCPSIKVVVFIGEFANDTVVGNNVFSYKTTTSNAIADYKFKNVGTGEFTFNTDTVKEGKFNNRYYERDNEGVLVNYILIVLDANGGECSTLYLHTDTDGKIVEELPTATRGGYTFDGWYFNGQKVTKETMFEQSTTIKAEWTYIPLTITFDANGGKCDVTTMKTKEGGTIDGTIPTPTREGYNFKGWYLNGEIVTTETVFTESTTVTAKWSGVTYTITFDAKGGECETETMTTDENGRLSSLPTATLKGYTFDGWYDGTTKITTSTVFTKDTTVTAKWTAVVTTYTIMFDANGGKCSVDKMETKADGTLPRIPAAILKGYNLDGWYLDGTKITTSTIFTEDSTVKAKWTYIPLTIKFNANGGTCVVQMMKTKEGGTIDGTIPTPTREGYNFEGWYLNGEIVTEDTVFTKSTTVTAKWTYIPLTIKFDANGGECDVKTMTTKEGGTIDGTLPTPTREGYNFEGWYLNGKKVTSETVFTKDTTVTAKWTAIGTTYIITFDANGGKCDVKTMRTNADGTLPSIPTATRDGFTFDGWYLNGKKVTSETVFTQNATVKAHWTVVPEPEPIPAENNGSNWALLAILVVAMLAVICVAAVKKN